MSLASDRPPASTKKTEAPYSMLPKQSRSQSGARPKVVDPLDNKNPEPPQSTRELELPELPQAGKIPSVVPASLKKPYSSLAPRPKDNQSEEKKKGTLPHESTTWNDTTEARRWSDNTEARRRLGTCKKHKITLSPQHECLLCKREASAKKTNPMLPIVLALIAVAALALLFALL